MFSWKTMENQKGIRLVYENWIASPGVGYAWGRY